MQKPTVVDVWFKWFQKFLSWLQLSVTSYGGRMLVVELLGRGYKSNDNCSTHWPQCFRLEATGVTQNPVEEWCAMSVTSTVEVLGLAQLSASVTPTGYLILHLLRYDYKESTQSERGLWACLHQTIILMVIGHVLLKLSPPFQLERLSASVQWPHLLKSTAMPH